ncbi:MAG: tetratricopeptide repeat protein [Hyphomicrobiales bacterium]
MFSFINYSAIARRSALAGLIAVSVVGCQTSGNSVKPLLGGGDEAAPNVGNATVQETTAWGKKWEASKGDPNLTLEYVARLRAINSDGRALAVLEEATKANPNSTALKGEYGKQLAKTGKFEQASVVLQRAAAAPDSTWQVNSTQGMVFDQLGRHGDAQNAYQTALKKSPNEVAVLNNLGLSQMQSGDLTGAEKTLRVAYASPAGKANPRVRQNLALVVGMQGRYEEAKEIAQKDLPPHMVEANMSYLRQMMVKQGG